MTIADVRDLFETIFPGLTDYYVGKMDASKERVITFRRGLSIHQRAIMKLESYDTIATNCILNGTRNMKETDELVENIRQVLLSVEHPAINGFEVVMLTIRNIVPLGINEKEIYDYAIDFEIVYKKKKED
jgi:hypothetical protein